MGYDLIALDPEADSFHFGAFSFPALLEACGYLFPCIHQGGRWYCAWGTTDPRFPAGGQYPGILSNDGFEVTAEEARIMARIARNVVAIQRTLPETSAVDDLRSKAGFDREDLLRMIQQSMHGSASSEPWPVKIRADFTDKFERFAAWAETSGGFRIV